MQWTGLPTLVRGASARQVVDVSIIESKVFALIGKW